MDTRDLNRKYKQSQYITYIKSIMLSNMKIKTKKKLTINNCVRLNSLISYF